MPLAGNWVAEQWQLPFRSQTTAPLPSGVVPLTATSPTTCCFLGMPQVWAWVHLAATTRQYFTQWIASLRWTQA